MTATKALVRIPDPREAPIQPGWAETVFLPEVMSVQIWDVLDEYEAKLRGIASYIASMDGDVLELEKALRIVEKRRGDLLGPSHQGERTDLELRTRMSEVAGKTAQRWRTIAQAWDEIWPEIRDATNRWQVTQAAVLRNIKTAEREQRTAGVMPEGVFNTIVADPPWKYDNTSTRGAAEDHYQTMTIDGLCELSVANQAAPESHLYLWTTNGFLREAFEVMDAWSFTYKTTLTWVKPQLGLGNYFRSCTEHILFGIRGGLGTRDSNQPNWFEARRTRHSQKPDRFYDMVEQVSYPPYLEMFSRRRRLNPDWSYWGDEA